MVLRIIVAGFKGKMDGRNGRNKGEREKEKGGRGDSTPNKFLYKLVI